MEKGKIGDLEKNSLEWVYFFAWQDKFTAIVNKTFRITLMNSYKYSEFIRDESEIEQIEFKKYIFKTINRNVKWQYFKYYNNLTIW